MFSNLFEANAITAVIGARGTERNLATLEYCRNDLCDVTDAIIVLGVTHIEHFVMNRLSRRFQCRPDRASNIQPMNQRSPGCSVACHADLLLCPGKARKVVQNDVEPHFGRSAVGGRISHERWRKIL